MPPPDMSAVGGGPLVQAVAEHVKVYMANYDGSHDFNHIRRVLGLALHIDAHAAELPARDPQVVVLAALLHDVGDKKYLQPGQDSNAMVRELLVSLGADSQLADVVQAVCLGVSYSSETKDPSRVQSLIRKHPELAVVQDADRLDAIGAVGIGRVFTFTGARTAASMGNSIQHFHDKLLRIQGMMKTEIGRKLAAERTERMKGFLAWWAEEEGQSGTASSIIGDEVNN